MTPAPKDNNASDPDTLKTSQTPPLCETMRLTNKRGLHARAAAKFFQCVEAFDVIVEVTSHNDIGSETIIADSTMELLMLGSACGEDITICTRGPDAKVTLDSLRDLVKANFGDKD